MAPRFPWSACCSTPTDLARDGSVDPVVRHGRRPGLAVSRRGGPARARGASPTRSSATTTRARKPANSCSASSGRAPAITSRGDDRCVPVRLERAAVSRELRLRCRTRAARTPVRAARARCRRRRAWPRSCTFDQRPFAEAAGSVSFADQGWLYVPSACAARRDDACRLHVVFHGCKQGVDRGRRRVRAPRGFLEAAEAGRIVVLFPQVKPTLQPLNPLGCWDWWGYEGGDYATRNGRADRRGPRDDRRPARARTRRTVLADARAH